MKTIVERTKFPTLSYLSCEGELSERFDGVLSEELLLKGYRAMVTTRHVDERMVTLQRQGTISFAMSSLGEEACSVASAAALDEGDWLYPQYRESGIMFYRGFSIQEYLHHMFCNGEDLIKGRQMPNHFGSRKLNVVQVSSPIGTKIPHAAGAAYAMKVKGEKRVALCYFGEGATSEGDFHAGVNFAAVRRVPAIFFCRNNGYAISTPAAEQFASDGIAPKGEGYGIEALRFDGNDFFAVYDAVSRARSLCLEGKGPLLLEAMTYRLGAHSTSDDPSRYRREEEVKEAEKRCPIRRLGLYLKKKGLLTDKEDKALLEEVQREVTRAIDVAKKTAPPPLRSLFEDVYFAIPERLKEQYSELSRFIEKERQS